LKSEGKQHLTLLEEKGVTNSTSGKAELPGYKIYTVKRVIYPCLTHSNGFYEENV
jgi:hypothetical protein